MWKWFKRALVALLLCWVGMGIYQHNRGGYFSLPDLPDDAYPISFKSGLRAILVDPEVTTDIYRDSWKHARRLTLANTERRYFALMTKVPFWMEDAWSFCYPATEAEKQAILDSLPSDQRPTYAQARLEGVCIVEADGQRTVRGAVFSAPKL
ncbi:MAG: hypothetical protein KBF78_05465 [Fuscovulum sp.]|nr:hypothetical protein [Fuscovulum sp.]